MSDDEEVRLTLRLPAQLRDRLTREAQSSGRSLNGEMVHRLEKTLDDEQLTEKSLVDIDKRLDNLEFQMQVVWEAHMGRDPYNIRK